MLRHVTSVVVTSLPARSAAARSGEPDDRRSERPASRPDEETRPD